MNTPAVYQERDILVDRAQSCRLRVLAKMPDRTYLIDVDHRLAWPMWRLTAELTIEVSAKEYTVSRSERRGLIGSKAKARAAKKKARFAPALKEVHQLFTPRGRGEAFREMQKAHGTSFTRRTFDRGVREYLKGGMTELAFAPAWHLCGRRPIDITKLNEIDITEAKAHALRTACAIDLLATPPPQTLADATDEGFPRKRRAPAAPTRYVLDRMTLRVFLEFYGWKLAELGRSLHDAWVRMRIGVFSVEGRDGTRQELPLGQLPSERQFINWFYVLTDHRSRRIALKGDHGFALGEREELGNEISQTLKAGAKASGDATIWNISIVSRLAGRRVVGCPIVFRIRCKRTGMLLGIAVTLENASWIGMAAAIANCMEDKVAFCAKIGLTITPDEWPCRGLMGQLDVDRGETDNHHPTRFIEVTSVNVVNLPPGRPEMKPGSESDWRTLEVRLNGKVPSALIETWEKSQNAKWKLEGVLDIDEFTRLLVKHELDRMKKPRDGVLLDDKMIAAGVDASPLSMWNYSVQWEAGGLSSFDEDEVKLSLLQRDKGASITERGVLFQGCYYTHEELESKHAFSVAKVHGRKAAGVAYDPRLVDFVYLEAIEGRELDFPLVLRLNTRLEHQRSYVGKCFAEVRELQARNSINAAAAVNAYQASESETVRYQDGVVKEARAATAAAPKDGTSATQQLRDIPANRRDERNAVSPTQALTPFVPRPTPAAAASLPSPPQAPESPAPVATGPGSNDATDGAAASSPMPASRQAQALERFKRTLASIQTIQP